MACFSGGAYKDDVNIGSYSFLPVDINVGQHKLNLLDQFGRFLNEQQEQQMEFARRKEEQEEIRRQKSQEEFIHPKVKEAIAEMDQRKKYKDLIEEDVERFGKEAEALTDLIIAFTLDMEKLEKKMAEVEYKKEVVKIEQDLVK